MKVPCLNAHLLWNFMLEKFMNPVAMELLYNAQWTHQETIIYVSKHL